MSKRSRFGTVWLAGVLLLCVAAPAKVQAEPASGLSIVPIRQAEFWEVEVDNGLHLPLNSDGAFVSTTIDENGAITLKRTESAPFQWAHVRSQQVEIRPEIDLQKNPYLYFDFTATTEWNINLLLNSEPLSIAKGITAATPGKKPLTNVDADGTAGTYQGKFNLYEYIQKESAKVPNMKGKTKVLVPQVNLFIVDTTSDHLSGELTVRQLSIGNDEKGGPEGLILDSSIAVDSDEGWEDLISQNTTHDPDAIAFADGARPAEKASVNYLLYVGAGVLVVAAAAVAALIGVKAGGRKKQGGGESK